MGVDRESIMWKELGQKQRNSDSLWGDHKHLSDVSNHLSVVRPVLERYTVPVAACKNNQSETGNKRKSIFTNGLKVFDSQFTSVSFALITVSFF